MPTINGVVFGQILVTTMLDIPVAHSLLHLLLHHLVAASCLASMALLYKDNLTSMVLLNKDTMASMAILNKVPMPHICILTGLINHVVIIGSVPNTVPTVIVTATVTLTPCNSKIL